MRSKVEPAWKCAEWKEKKMGFWWFFQSFYSYRFFLSTSFSSSKK